MGCIKVLAAEGSFQFFTRALLPLHWEQTHRKSCFYATVKDLLSSQFRSLCPKSLSNVTVHRGTGAADFQ